VNLKSIASELLKSGTLGVVIQGEFGDEMLVTVSPARFLTVKLSEPGGGDADRVIAVIPVGIVAEEWVENLLEVFNSIEGKITPLDL
jgi:prefoldin subunit 5